MSGIIELLNSFIIPPHRDVDDGDVGVLWSLMCTSLIMYQFLRNTLIHGYIQPLFLPPIDRFVLFLHHFMLQLITLKGTY